MRIASMYLKPQIIEKTDEVMVVANFSFTSNAINYLTCEHKGVNLKEWIWHEELINGIKYYIITDKLVKDN